MKKTITAIAIITVIMTMLLSLTGCGGKGSYSDYSKAYEKTASVGSLNVEFTLDIDKGDETVSSTGNMKMNSDGDVYYEMVINGKEIMQYVQDGVVHTFVDGNEQISSTDNKDKGAEKADPDGGEGQPNEKTDESEFNSAKFLEEFSGILEAGKIKEMGVLDPIPSKYIKEITKTTEDDKTVFTMTFPDEFLSLLLDTMIEEQLNGNDNGLSFSNLKDFTCVSKANADGYLDYIQYKGYTSVTVPSDYMTSGVEETFDLKIDLQMNIINPGTAVDVVISTE